MSNLRELHAALYRPGHNNGDSLAFMAAAMEEVPRLLREREEVIRVLEDFHGLTPCSWWHGKAKPLLDNLKARGKDGSSN